jgi:hypothetical protein
MHTLFRKLSVASAIVTLATLTAAAQSPDRWLMQKGAPVPAPEEEFWNTTANGKLYLMGGNQGGAMSSKSQRVSAMRTQPSCSCSPCSCAPIRYLYPSRSPVLQVPTNVLGVL